MLANCLVNSGFNEAMEMYGSMVLLVNQEFRMKSASDLRQRAVEFGTELTPENWLSMPFAFKEQYYKKYPQKRPGQNLLPTPTPPLSGPSNLNHPNNQYNPQFNMAQNFATPPNQQFQNPFATQTPSLHQQQFPIPIPMSLGGGVNPNNFAQPPTQQNVLHRNSNESFVPPLSVDRLDQATQEMFKYILQAPPENLHALFQPPSDKNRTNFGEPIAGPSNTRPRQTNQDPHHGI